MKKIAIVLCVLFFNTLAYSDIVDNSYVENTPEIQESGTASETQNTESRSLPPHDQEAESNRVQSILSGSQVVKANEEVPPQEEPTQFLNDTGSNSTPVPTKDTEEASEPIPSEETSNIDINVTETYETPVIEESNIKITIQETVTQQSEEATTIPTFLTTSTKKEDIIYDLIIYQATTPDWKETHPNPFTIDSPWLLVGVRSQTMQQFDSWGRLIKNYPISTAKRGVGEIENSYQTPRGHHKICRKIGDGLPAREIFNRRQPTGVQYSRELRTQYPTKDWILTRIMWLCGQEDGKNKGYNQYGQLVDSYDRYIYIHGAGDHAPFGVSPSSLGCVRMISEDVIDVFNSVPNGTDVFIDENK